MGPVSYYDDPTKVNHTIFQAFHQKSEDFNAFTFDDTKEKQEILMQVRRWYKQLVAAKDADAEKLIAKFEKEKDMKFLGIFKGDRNTFLKEGDEKFEITKGHRKEVLKKGDDTLEMNKGNKTWK